MPANLPLAARAAAAPEVNVSAALKADLQQALIARTQDMTADLRARIAAGLALGTLGDPRFERRTGPHGDYLLPPRVRIPAGDYPIGDDDSSYDEEKPAHKVPLEAFEIGMFPVTNAEYALFMAGGGYEDERWWETDDAKAWLRGEGGTEGQKSSWREFRQRVLGWTEESIRNATNFTSRQKSDYFTLRRWTDERFEEWLDEQFPSGQRYRQPEFWNDARYNNPAQPVVGVTWFEARAYCAWLTAQARGDAGTAFLPSAMTQGDSTDARYGVPNDGISVNRVMFRLPTEVEFEAAARGLTGRKFPYGDLFDSARSNTFESHIRGTTPVGIFENATPEGAYDLSGNVYSWTTTIYDQDRYPYPYQKADGREDANSTEVRRVLRGGSWYYLEVLARAVYRNFDHPYYRNLNIGFRLVAAFVPSQKL